MERGIETVGSSNVINISDRKSMQINGVNKIESFDEEEFLLDTNLGFLAIKGNNLEIVRLDTKDGVLYIKGMIDSLAYFDTIKRNTKSSLIEKLFK